MRRYKVTTTFYARDDAEARARMLKHDFGRGSVTKLVNLDAWLTRRAAVVFAISIAILATVGASVVSLWRAIP